MSEGAVETARAPQSFVTPGLPWALLPLAGVVVGLASRWAGLPIDPALVLLVAVAAAARLGGLAAGLVAAGIAVVAGVSAFAGSASWIAGLAAACLGTAAIIGWRGGFPGRHLGFPAQLALPTDPGAAVAVFAQDRRLRYVWSGVAGSGTGLARRTDGDLPGLGDAQRLAELKRQVLESGRAVRADVAAGGPDGRRWYDVLLSPVGNGPRRVQGLVGIVVDVTERRRAEEALRLADTRLSTVLANTGIVLYTQDRDLHFTWIRNPRRSLTVEQVVGRTDFDVMPREDAERLVPLKRQVIDTGERIRTQVEIGPPWERYAYDLSIDPLRGDDGTVEGIICAAVNITEQIESRRAAEKAQAEAVQILEEAERTAQARAKLLAAAGHDLRQPFHSMHLFLHLLEMQLDSDSQKQLLARVGDCLETGERFLHTVLDAAALDAGTVKPNIDAFPLGDLLNRIHAEHRAMAEERGLGLRCRPTSLHVRSDPVLLERMVRNLVRNALAFTPAGRVLIGVRRRGGMAVVQVWDTGVGIPEDQLSAVFDDFHRVVPPAGTGASGQDRNRNERNKGLGLGLAVVRRTARLLSHRLDVRSVAGRGSVFEIEMPIAGTPVRRPAMDTRTPAVAAKVPGNGLAGKIVAVVEDDALQLMALRETLTGWGCRVLSASDGDAIVAALRASGDIPDFILSDYRLSGGMLGDAVVQAVRTVAGRDIPGLVLTGDADADLHARLAAARIGVAYKPFNTQGLKQAITEMVEV
ncbi:MAG TPA: PAS domain-containing protein [Azospirillaceae bacterium]|nr:PAS domain-containing protein [Azospirillaceae bacterium]